MAIPLTGSPPPPSVKSLQKAGGFVARRLLNSIDSLDSGTSIGHWQVYSGATVSRASNGGDVGWRGSIDNLLITTASNGQGSRIGWPNNDAFPTDWTAKIGHRYRLIYAWRSAAAPAGDTIEWDLALGAGADKATRHMVVNEFTDVSANIWQYEALDWVPTAEHPASDATVDFTRFVSGTAVAGSHVLELAYVQVFEVPGDVVNDTTWLTIPQTSTSVPILASPGFGFIISPIGQAHPPALNLYRNQGQWALVNGYSGISGYFFTGGQAYLYGWAEHAAADLSDKGIDFETGIDYVGVEISEKDPDTVQFYADVAGGYHMELRDRGTGKGWETVNAAGTYTRRLLHESFQWAFHKTGAQTVAAAINEFAEYLQAGYAFVIDEVRVHLGTAPTGAAFLVDVNINGTTVFTTQANRPSVAISGTDATSGVADGGQAGAKNDRVSVDVDQVGSTIAGSDLTVMVRGRYTH